MHVTWCCVSVLKSDPKIPKSRDRRQNLVATLIINGWHGSRLELETKVAKDCAKFHTHKEGPY